MKPVKRSVAVVVRRPGEPAEFLVVRRPQDPDDPLAGLWGLPAITLDEGEGERAAVVRAGRVKLGVELTPGSCIGQKAADRGAYLLRLADYEAVLAAGTPDVPQPDASLTQYTACRFTADPAVLAEAAARGSLCAQLYLEDNSKKRLAAASPSHGTVAPDNSKKRLAAREPGKAGEPGKSGETGECR
jgi:ADP-ribose pyrophosphatase YjhB (NUDIX family)